MNTIRWLLIAGALAVAPSVFAQAKVELEFPSWQAEEPGVDRFWKESIAAFEASHPNVHINLYQVPFKEYIDKLTVRFASNNPPPIVQLPTRNLPSFASQGWLAPLDDMIAKTDIKATYTSMSAGNGLGQSHRRRAAPRLWNDVLLQRSDVAGRRRQGAHHRGRAAQGHPGNH